MFFNIIASIHFDLSFWTSITRRPNDDVTHAMTSSLARRGFDGNESLMSDIAWNPFICRAVVKGDGRSPWRQSPQPSRLSVLAISGWWTEHPSCWVIHSAWWVVDDSMTRLHLCGLSTVVVKIFGPNRRFAWLLYVWCLWTVCGRHGPLRAPWRRELLIRVRSLSPSSTGRRGERVVCGSLTQCRHSDGHRGHSHCLEGAGALASTTTRDDKWTPCKSHCTFYLFEAFSWL